MVGVCSSPWNRTCIFSVGGKSKYYCNISFLLMLQLLTQLNMTTITRKSNPKTFPCDNMLITLCKGSNHVHHGTERVSSTSEVKINIIALSHFLLCYNYFQNVYVLIYCVKVMPVERHLLLPWSRVTVEGHTLCPIR